MTERKKVDPRDDIDRPDPANEDEKLDEALKESFPASDAPAPAHPDITGWEPAKDDENSESGKRRR